MVEESTCTSFVRERALRVRESLAPDRIFLETVFATYSASSDSTDRGLANAANGLLITQYGDEAALRWRLSKVKTGVERFRKPIGAHTVSPIEDELTHSMAFAQPLMAFGRLGYEDQYLSLLDEALKVWTRGTDFHVYAEYLWSIVYGHFETLKSHRSYEPLRRLERKIEAVEAQEGANWLAGRMAPLRRAYLTSIGKPKHLSGAIARYNDARRDQNERILTSSELYAHLREAMDTELRRWIEGEGGYSLILGEKVTTAKKQEYEKLIQKTLKTQVENILLRRGFSVDVIREPDLLDDMRTDFLIRYGFAGPVVMEIKLTSHPDARAVDVRSTKSYSSMAQYMLGYGATHGLLVAIANEKPDRLERLARGFDQLPNVGTIGFDATGRDAAPGRAARTRAVGPVGRRKSRATRAANAPAASGTRGKRRSGGPTAKRAARKA